MSFAVVNLACKQSARQYYDSLPVKPRRMINGSYYIFATGQPIGTVIVDGKFTEGPWGKDDAGNGDAFGVKDDGSPHFGRVWPDASDPRDFYFRDCISSYPGPAPIWRGVIRPIEAKPVDKADAKKSRSCIYRDKKGNVQMGVFHNISLDGLRNKLFSEYVTDMVALDGGGSCFYAEGEHIIYDSGEGRKIPNIIVEWGEDATTGGEPLNIIQKMIPTTNKNYTGQAQLISFITIHNTGNYAATSGAKNHADWLYNGAKDKYDKPQNISWHYSVDKSSIYQSLPDDIQGRHSGGLGNTQGVGIEICVNDKTGFPDACKLAAKLTASLMKKYNIIIEEVKQHYYWSGKNCPAELRSGAWGVSWEQFLQMVRNEITSAYVPPVARPTLRKGSKGADVKDMQRWLMAHGQQLPKYGTDGDFGAETDTAVRAFQKVRGLVVDGICGPITWSELLEGR